MDYLTLKHAHAGLAYLSLVLFVVRFALFYFASKWRSNKALKIAPHVIDTTLFVFAMIMLFSASFGLSHAWVLAKVLGLLMYIGFGVMAIRKGKTWGFAGALASYTYVLGVAKSKSVLSWLVFLN